MKKILCLALCAILMMGMAGCGGSQQSSEGGEDVHQHTTPMGYCTDCGKIADDEGILSRLDKYHGEITDYLTEGTNLIVEVTSSNGTLEDCYYAMKDAVSYYENAKEAVGSFVSVCRENELFYDVADDFEDLIEEIPTSVKGSDADSIIEFLDEIIDAQEDFVEATEGYMAVLVGDLGIPAE